VGRQINLPYYIALLSFDVHSLTPELVFLSAMTPARRLALHVAHTLNLKTMCGVPLATKLCSLLNLEVRGLKSGKIGRRF
jgi:hypothetical protein